MDRSDFGKLLSALRKEHFDADGNRLTQAGLAMRAEQIGAQNPLNETIVGKIERGERANLDDQTLLRLADALELTMGERPGFFLAATGLDNEQIFPASKPIEDVLATALQVLADIQLPALLLDSYLNVVAVNGILLQLYDTSRIELHSWLHQPSGLNLLSLVFSPEFESQRKLMTQHEWHDLVVGIMIYFRRVTLPYRMTPYFSALYTQLRRNREFRWFWEQVFYEEKRQFVGADSLIIGVPGSSKFNVLTAPLVTLTPYGNLEIITHIPRNASTATAFQQMAAAAPDTVLQLSPWPEK